MFYIILIDNIENVLIYTPGVRHLSYKYTSVFTYNNTKHKSKKKQQNVENNIKDIKNGSKKAHHKR